MPTSVNQSSGVRTRFSQAYPEASIYGEGRRSRLTAHALAIAGRGQSQQVGRLSQTPGGRRNGSPKEMFPRSVCLFETLFAVNQSPKCSLLRGDRWGHRDGCELLQSIGGSRERETKPFLLQSTGWPLSVLGSSQLRRVARNIQPHSAEKQVFAKNLRRHQTRRGAHNWCVTLATANVDCCRFGGPILCFLKNPRDARIMGPPLSP
jgi:hypothetical protein